MKTLFNSVLFISTEPTVIPEKTWTIGQPPMSKHLVIKTNFSKLPFNRMNPPEPGSGRDIHLTQPTGKHLSLILKVLTTVSLFCYCPSLLGKWELAHVEVTKDTSIFTVHNKSNGMITKDWTFQIFINFLQIPQTCLKSVAISDSWMATAIFGKSNQILDLSLIFGTLSQKVPNSEEDAIVKRFSRYWTKKESREFNKHVTFIWYTKKRHLHQ